MTREEADVLYEQSIGRTLRSPNSMLCDDTKKSDGLLKSTLGLIYFKHATKFSSFERSLYFFACKRALKKHEFVKKLKGYGTDSKPYKLSTAFGEGEFVDMHYIFKNGQIPKSIQKNYCFSNCLNASKDLAKEKYDCTVLTGIANFGGPFLHSVLQCWHGETPQVLDFNYDLVMDEALYLKLFSFEVLSKVSGQALLQAESLITSDDDEVIKDYQLLLAYDDCIRYKQEELSHQQQMPATEKEESHELTII